MSRFNFDDIDATILKKREQTFNKLEGPRIGDFVRTEKGLRRFTHDWGDDIQVTFENGTGENFYLGDGHVSYSGGLDSAIEKSKIIDTGEKMDGVFWFFHHDLSGAYRDVYCKIACRIFKVVK